VRRDFSLKRHEIRRMFEQSDRQLILLQASGAEESISAILFL
jgi:hypothetical protein